MYHLIKAKAMKKLGNLEECLKALQVAMNLPGVRKAGTYMGVFIILLMWPT